MSRPPAREFKPTFEKDSTGSRRIALVTALAKERRLEFVSKRRHAAEAEGKEPEEPTSFTDEEIAAAVAAVRQAAPGSAARLQGLRRIRQMVSSAEPPIAQLLKAGLFPVLVQELRDGDVQGQTEALWALSNIASDTHEHTRQVMPAAPILVQMLHGIAQQAPLLQEQVIWCLGNLAADGPDTRRALLSQGVLQPLVKNLAAAVAACKEGMGGKEGESAGTGSPEKRKTASATDTSLLLGRVSAWALSNLVTPPSIPANHLFNSGIVPPVIACLQLDLPPSPSSSSSPALSSALAVGSLIAEAAWVLAWLCCLPLDPSRAEGVAALLKAGLAPLLIKRLQMHSTAALRKATGVSPATGRGLEGEEEEDAVDASILLPVIRTIGYLAQGPDPFGQSLLGLPNPITPSLPPAAREGQVAALLDGLATCLQPGQHRSVRHQAAWILSNLLAVSDAEEEEEEQAERKQEGKRVAAPAAAPAPPQQQQEDERFARRCVARAIFRAGFLPALVELFVKAHFELQRELAFAIYNLARTPLELSVLPAEVVNKPVLSLRPSPADYTLRAVLAVGNGAVLRPMVSLLRTRDVEAADIALTFIELALARGGEEAVAMVQEADGIEALEYLQTAAYHSDNAGAFAELWERAHELIDRYYGDDEDNAEAEEQDNGATGASTAAPFSFGAATSGPFAFGPQQQQQQQQLPMRLAQLAAAGQLQWPPQQ